MKTIKQLSVYILLLVLATGCIEQFNIRGNGMEATEERVVPIFNKVKSSGSFDVVITNGEQFEVLVNAEENILPYIETTVSGNTLLIDIPGIHNVRNRLPMNVFITIPELKGVKQSGSGNITTDYFTTQRMELFISGSGSISTEVNADVVDASISGSGWMLISGGAGESNLNISGSGNINSSGLAVLRCNALISGSGNMQVKAEKSIFARISGSGNLYYYGNPRIETSISGSGKIIPAR
jgi:hypothetical protein